MRLIYCFAVMMLFAVASVSAQSGKEQGPTTMLLYYVSFAADTSAGQPITIESIERYAYDVLSFTDGHPQVIKTYRLLSSRPAKRMLNTAYIRLKVVFDRDVFYMDIEGRIVRENVDTAYRLSKEELNGLIEDIERFRGVVDLKAAEKFKSAAAAAGTKSGTGQDDKVKKSKQ